jgi:crotonobetainyl-CoA:carnitine CoA-transferase CaiB-like acyl-CoA transferase
VNARTGLPFMTGPKDEAGPVNHVLPAWDLVTGQMVAVGLLAAERHRRRTGQGQHVKLALEDVALAVIAHLGFITEARLGSPRQRHGNELFGAFGRDFVCADGQRVMVVGLTLKQWRTLVEALDLAAEIEQLQARWAPTCRRKASASAPATRSPRWSAAHRRQAAGGNRRRVRPPRRLLGPLPGHRGTGARRPVVLAGQPDVRRGAASPAWAPCSRPASRWTSAG